MQRTIIISKSAMAVACVFTGVTAYVLLEDVFRHGAAINVKHVMTFAVLLGAIYYGHAAVPQFRAGQYKNALGALFLGVLGTLTCVLMASGRNAEAVNNKVLAANDANTDRARVLTDRNEAKARYLSALKAEDTECASGDGAKCRAKRVSTTLRRQDLDVAEAALRKQPAEVVANGNIKASAELISKLPYVTASTEAIEAALLLIEPFFLSVFCELSAIVGFGMALGYRQAPVAPQLPPPVPLTAVAEPVAPVVEPVVEPAIDPEWVPISLKQAQELARRARAEAVFEALREAAPLSNDELAARIGVDKGQCSRRVTDLQSAGLVRRVPAPGNGRYVAITLRPLTE